MLKYTNLFILLLGGFISKCYSEYEVITLKTFVYWPNATVPFYINPDHFDSEQANIIMKSLAMFAFKTCIKFAPVMAAPTDNQHVMTFVNPEGIRRCRIETKGHSTFSPHLIQLGYDCLKTSDLDMMIARALGMPFEHNRMSRDIYIEVMIQNVEPGYIQLFTKDRILPSLLRQLPYDRNSIMHFRERDYSKNGRRTIVFKDRNFHQNRDGLTATDIKKFALIYGPECRARDRAEKIAMCKSYPGVRRRKREILEPFANRSLRVNPNITPPPHLWMEAGIAKDETAEKLQEIAPDIDVPKNVSESLNILGIVRETDRITELVYQLSALALKNAREKYCNATSNETAKFEFNYEKTANKTEASDVLGIHRTIAGFAKSIIEDAASNLTEFCQNSKTVEDYQNQCKLDGDAQCPKAYRTSKSGAMKIVSKHKLVDKGSNSDENVPIILKPNRRKREANDSVITPELTEEIKEKEEQKETEINNEGKKENNLKEKLKAIRNERLKEVKKPESIIKSALVSSTMGSKVKNEFKGPTRRNFHEKRYKVQKSQEVSDWESDTSMDKQIEPQKSLTNKELLKKVLELGAGSIFKTKKAKKESVEEVNNHVKKEEKTAETSAESSKTEDYDETSEEDTEKAVTKRKKEYKETEESSSEEVKHEEKKETPQPRIKHKSQRTHNRGIPKTVELTKLNKEFYGERKWPDGVVFYVIAELQDYDLKDLRKRLAAVNRILLEKTCVKLREINAKEAPGFEDYLILDTSPDYVTGRVGGKQNFGSIELFEGSHHRQHTAMMVMAMLGFYFEVSRHDRDKHIRVHNRHIRADKLHHFEKIRDEATFNLPYDYKSATHPAWQFWRRTGKKGISTVATYKEQVRRLVVFLEIFINKTYSEIRINYVYRKAYLYFSFVKSSCGIKALEHPISIDHRFSNPPMLPMLMDPDGSIMRSLGQNPELLSEIDIIKINSVYGVECFERKRSSSKKRNLRMLKDEDSVIQ